MTAVITIGGAVQSSGRVIAYVDQSVRGIQESTSNPPFGPYAGTQMYQITLYANVEDETITFSYEKGSALTVLFESLTFTINGNAGDVITPFVLTGTATSPPVSSPPPAPVMSPSPSPSPSTTPSPSPSPSPFAPPSPSLSVPPSPSPAPPSPTLA